MNKILNSPIDYEDIHKPVVLAMANGAACPNPSHYEGSGTSDIFQIIMNLVGTPRLLACSMAAAAPAPSISTALILGALQH